MKILIVDDSALNRGLIYNMLVHYGDRHMAVGGREAVKMFQEALDDDAGYDLICLDITMPEMDGFDVLKTIRKIEADRSVPAYERVNIVMISSLSDKETILKTGRLAQGFVVKPVNKHLLFKKLHELGFKPVPKPERHDEVTIDFPDDSEDEADVIIEAFEEKMAEEIISELEHELPVLTEKNGALIFRVWDSEERKHVYRECVDVAALHRPAYGKPFVRLDVAPERIQMGKGIGYNAKEKTLVAGAIGQVMMEGCSIWIEDSMIIHENLVGRQIDTAGAVEIHGDVQDGLTVIAEKGITVRGVVGACFLESNGNVDVFRMYGQKKGRVHCGGRFRADAVYNSSVEAHRSIHIERESVGATLKSNSHITAGVVTGGTCIARHTISLRRAGSPKDVSTVLKTGMDFETTDRLKEVDQKLAEVDVEIARLSTLLGPYADELEKVLHYQEPRQTRILELAGELFTARYVVRAELEEEQQRLSDQLKMEQEAKIEVAEILYKGVSIEMGQTRKLINDDIEGPVVITYNVANNLIDIQANLTIL